MKRRWSVILLVIAVVCCNALQPRLASASGTPGNSQKAVNSNTTAAPQSFSFDLFMKSFQKKPENGSSEKPTQSKKGSGKVAAARDSKTATVVANAGEESVNANTPQIYQTPKIPKIPKVPRIPRAVIINPVVRNLGNMNAQIKRLKEKEAAENKNKEGQSWALRTTLDDQKKDQKKKKAA